MSSATAMAESYTLRGRRIQAAAALAAILGGMRVLTALVVWTLSAALAPAQDAVAPPPRALRVLFVGAPTANGPHHDPITRYRMLKRGLGVEGIHLTYSEDPAAAFSTDGLAPFDAVLLYGNWDQHGVMPKPQLDALLAFVEGGGGFLPVHCASACWGRSPAFVKLVGGRFVRHGGEEFTVDDVQPDHPVLAGLPGFRAWDETYEHDEHGDDRTILQRRRNEPWTWVRTQGKGRVFYTAAGHDHRVWDRPEFQQLLRNAVLWAVGDEKRALLDGFALPKLEQEAVSLPGYLHRREITMAQKPLRPADSQKLIQVPLGMDCELFASEPDIVNPIHVAWDHRGRAFVVETIDYPNNLQARDLGHDRITICEDTDGDGRADRFTRFAEGLSIPTSIVFANGGVICTNGPDVLFLADTDHDDRADVRKVLFTGFHMGDTHAGISNLKYGFDGMVWATIGYSGFSGEVGGVRHEFAQGVLRFAPDGSSLEFLQNTTNNTWGLGFTSAFDVVGSTANGNPSWFATFPDATYRAVGLEPHSTPRADDDPHWFPIANDLRQADWFEHFTAAAGHAVYTATRFPAAYHERRAFVCEPTGKLVATFDLERQGGGFRARQSPNNLFASADAWTSPVCAEVGPDGAVWICDWYNLVIQHNPAPTKRTAGMDARIGKGNAYETPLRDERFGRIWRVFPTGSANDRIPRMDPTDPAISLQAMSHGNLLWRLHGQRLLVERGERDFVPQLTALAREGTAAAPHALHALAQLRALPDDVVAGALRSPHEPTRRAALRLANVAVLKATFVEDGKALPIRGRDLAELLVRFAETAADPEIADAILRTGVAAEPAIFADVTLRDAWSIAARRHAADVLAAAHREGIELGTKRDPINLLPNPSFSETAKEGTPPAGWADLRVYQGAPAENVTVTRDPTGGRDGSPALRVSTERASDCGVAVTVPVKAGTRYRLSGRIRTENVVPVRGSDGVMLNVHGMVRTEGVAGTKDWTEVTVEFDAEEDGEIVVHCLFGGWGGARGTAWFDDVSLVAIGSGNSLVGSLETLATLTEPAAAAAPTPRERAFAIDAAVHARGSAVYSRTCIACHGLDGRGLPPAFPPLDGSEWLTGPAETAIDIVLHGVMGAITVKGARFDSLMPPLGATLSDSEIADALTFARQRWSNDAAPVTAEQVKTRRELHRERTTPWTAPELTK